MLDSPTGPPPPPPPTSSSSDIGFVPSSASDDPNGPPVKRKRRPAGTPDPDAEVVSLSPKTLLESDRYVCEICNQGFQRDQNLQMHRRRHKVPWKLLKRDGQDPASAGGANKVKRVYVCPEPSCLHHDPCHALGDLVGIKKHFRRKHSNHKQWVCERCSKGYAVQSDYKAHLKTCGTRGHSCDCGRVFSRVESFIEHQDACTVRRAILPEPPNSSRTASSMSPLNEPNLSSSLLIPTSPPATPAMPYKPQETNSSDYDHLHNLELQLQPTSLVPHKDFSTDLNLSVGLSHTSSEIEESDRAMRLREFAGEQLRLAAAEKAFAEEARKQARRQVELAEQEFANAQRIRMQAQSEFERAHALKEEALRKIASAITQVTCAACRRQFQAVGGPQLCEETSTQSLLSSATTTTEGEEE
ncbi:zinc finger protein SHOOT GRAVITROPISM 5-like [Punica granatum]|uniref:C2H2-type domain-containing protein n=2 Tax=Punica granatum TaxID=22663 RepID=A0A218Y0G7_PUNGR|nr:zinc finger protein SHOOT GRAVITROPISM 5-like [Punica granatum]OWM90714.1 hypothetical protein CDL15_Pgr021019 [Punica granatum]PKI46832.1 hypothetical protein CRG98_032770 [Punica granatum]